MGRASASQRTSLLNLSEEPYEPANLAHNTSCRVKRAQLQEQLAGWMAETGDTFALSAW